MDEAERAFIAGDMATATTLLQQPPLADSAPGLVRQVYLATHNGPTDRTRLTELALNAARSDGLSVLGFRLFHGLGVDEDKRLAYWAYWYAASSGDTDAMFALAGLYESGWPAKNRPLDEEAYRLYYVAGELGHLAAKDKAQRLAPQIDPKVHEKVAADAAVWKKRGEELP